MADQDDPQKKFNESFEAGTSKPKKGMWDRIKEGVGLADEQDPDPMKRRLDKIDSN